MTTINRKHGRQSGLPHPDFQHISLKPILETCRLLFIRTGHAGAPGAGQGVFSGGADLLRRAMGKKPEEMAKQRSTFEEGAASQG